MKLFLSTTLLIAFFGLSTGLIAQTTAYTTNTGTKYHADGCRYLSKSKIKTTIEDAKTNGFGACSVCKPKASQTQTHTTSVKPAATTPKTAPAPQAKPAKNTSPTRSTSTSVQCSATTQAGNRCKRSTTASSGKCWQHD
jgi:hypothetical protein